MKVLFVLCAVVAFAHAYPTQQDANEFNGFLGLINKGPAEMKCLEEAWRKIEKENPKLESWFKDVEKSVEGLKKQAEACEAITKPIEAIKCYRELSTKAKAELDRLVKALPEEDREAILEKLRTAIQGCINNLSALLGLTSKGPAELKCLEEAWRKIEKENPKLESWFKDVEKSIEGLKKQAETCEAITKPIDAIKCYTELLSKGKSEFERLTKALPEEDRDVILKLLRAAVDGCINNNFTALFGLTRDTPEQLRCMKDAWNKIEKENPQLESWFKDVEKSIEALKKEAEDCKSIDKPINAIGCYLKTAAHAKEEYERWMNALSDEDKQAILGKLRTAATECINNNP